MKPVSNFLLILAVLPAIGGCVTSTSPTPTNGENFPAITIQVLDANNNALSTPVTASPPTVATPATSTAPAMQSSSNSCSMAPITPLAMPPFNSSTALGPPTYPLVPLPPSSQNITNTTSSFFEVVTDARDPSNLQFFSMTASNAESIQGTTSWSHPTSSSSGQPATAAKFLSTITLPSNATQSTAGNYQGISAGDTTALASATPLPTSVYATLTYTATAPDGTTSTSTCQTPPIFLSRFNSWSSIATIPGQPETFAIGVTTTSTGTASCINTSGLSPTLEIDVNNLELPPQSAQPPPPYGVTMIDENLSVPKPVQTALVYGTSGPSNSGITQSGTTFGVLWVPISGQEYPVGHIIDVYVTNPDGSVTPKATYTWGSTLYDGGITPTACWQQ